MRKDKKDNTQRLKTELNASEASLLAAPGVLLTAQFIGDDGEAQPDMVQMMPIDQTWKRLICLPNGKCKEVEIKSTKEYLEAMVANTQAVWSGKLPGFINHNPFDVAHGAFDPATMVVNDSGLWIANGFDSEMQKAIADGKWLYISIGWYNVYFDPKTGKTLGPTAHEISVTNVPYFRSQEGLAANDIQGICAVVPVDAANFNNKSEENDMTDEQLALLGLKPDATAEAITAAMTKQKAAADDYAAVREALPINDGESAADAITALIQADETKEPEKPAEEKPAEEIDQALAANAIGADMAGFMIASMVDAGKIAPKSAKIPKLTEMLAKMQAHDAKLFVEAIPAKADQSSLTEAGDQGTASEDEYNPEALAACGLPADYAKGGK